MYFNYLAQSAWNDQTRPLKKIQMFQLFITYKQKQPWLMHSRESCILHALGSVYHLVHVYHHMNQPYIMMLDQYYRLCLWCGMCLWCICLLCRVQQETGLYEYKVFGSLPSCSPDLCADVYMDLNYRRQWDSYVKGMGLQKSQSNIFIKTIIS